MAIDRDRMMDGLILLSGGVAVAATVACLSSGMTVVFPHLYYFPIIIAAYRYPSFGVPVAAIVAGVYLSLVALFDPSGASGIDPLARVVLFLILGAVISYLSRVLHSQQEALHRREWDLKRRFQQLSTIYSVSQLVEEGPVGESLDQVVNLVAGAMQDPERAMCRCTLGDRVAATPGFAKSGACISSDILIQGDPAGTLEVCYRWSGEHGTTAPRFSEDDRILIDAVATRIQRALDRQMAREALEERENKFRTLFSSASDAIFLADRNGRILDANRETCERLGYTLEELRQLAIVDIDQDTDLFDPRIDELMQTGSLTFETVHIARDGSTIPTEINARVVTIRGEEAILGIGRDISERKEAERAIRENEERFRTVTEVAYDAIIMIDAQGWVTLWNEAAERIFGYRAEEARGKRVHDLVASPEDRDLAEQGLVSFRETGTGPIIQQTRELVATGKEGRQLPVEITVSPVRTGGEWHAVAIVRDISDRVERERELRIKDAAIESSVNPIAIGDLEGTLTYVNRAFLEMWGCRSRNEAIGRPAESFWASPGKAREVMEELEETGDWTGELMGRRRDGTPINVVLQAAMVSNQEGEPLCMMASFMDVTEERRYRDALESANRKLNLLSSITRHDILNQVQGLLTYTHILSEIVPGDSEGQMYVEKCRMITETIQRQITFTRDYEQLGVQSPSWQRVADVARNAAEDVLTAAVTLQVTTDSLEIYADPMLWKVFYNLFDNAVRHGRTVTTVSVTATFDDDHCTILVSDDGEGIAPSIKNRIFTRGIGTGTGFGLFLTREILDLTDISIEETGEPGGGATFAIHLPPGRWRTAPA
ncbi:MAG: PAS domain S-box protein [Methanomicrobiales archaeon]